MKGLLGFLFLATFIARAELSTPIGLWHADGNAQDAIGSNHGTLMGGAGFASGVAGQGFALDGANDYIRVPDSTSLHLSDELTIEMWFKREDAASYGPLIDKRNLTTCNFGAIIAPDWGFQLYYDDPAVFDGNQYEISFSPLPVAEVFHYFAGTYRQIDSSHVELKTYIDGALVQTDTRRGNLANTFNGNALSIGSARDGDPGSSFFRGVIDEIAIYNYALSSAQILSNYTTINTNVPPPPPPPPASPTLIAFWRGEGDAQDTVGTNHGMTCFPKTGQPGVGGI